MVDASSAPRRVSMAYILGFSNKPFKDGGPPAPHPPRPPPPPRHPNAFRHMVTTPGGVIEWAASDGRRGKLTGPGKQRLTAADISQAPGGTAPIQVSAKTQAAEHALAVSHAAVTNNPVDSAWTKEQDDKLLELRAKSGGHPWAETANELEKRENDCKNRFKQIKPKDWKPDNAQAGGGGKKKGKQKGQEDQNIQSNGKKAENLQDGSKADNSADVWPGLGLDGCNVDDSRNSGDDGKKDESGAEEVGGWDSAWNPVGDTKDDKCNGANGPRNNTASGVNSDPNAFDPTNVGWGAADTGDNGAAAQGDPNAGSGGSDQWATYVDKGANTNTAAGQETSWNTNNDIFQSTPLNTGPYPHNAAPTPNDAAAQPASKQHSARGSDKAPAAAPTEYELRPDSTFSAEDLRLVAKILQQDCHMVWNRVSWRFRDKTGRDLHPDVFEKKITGRCQGDCGGR